MNLESGAVLLVSRRLSGVVLERIQHSPSMTHVTDLGVKEASNGGALGRRDPEVGRASVKHDLERLRRSAERDFREVLSIDKVGQRDVVRSFAVLRDHLDLKVALFFD